LVATTTPLISYNSVMPSPQDKGYFLELNDSFLLAARTVTPGRPTVIEDIREASLDNKAAVSQALGAVFPAAGAAVVRVVCSVRPRDRFFLLASEKDTPKASSLAALRALAGNSTFSDAGPSELVGIDAHLGLPLDGKPGSRWFVAGAPKESLSGVRAALGEWKIAPSRLEAATVSLLGVVQAEQQRSKGAPALVWEIGESTSDLFVVSARGIEAVKRLPFGLDRLADSVQAELGMKSRGAATRIFFNEFYDFSEVGPKIAARVAGSLQPAITEITGPGGAPGALICTGLASKQNWFGLQLAKALNLSPWGPDLTTWCNSSGVTFVGNTLQPKLSPLWFGLLGMMSAIPADRADTEAAWHPGWSTDGVEREEKPRAAEVVPAPEPAPAPAPVRAPSTPPSPKIVPPTPSVFAAVPVARPAPAPQPPAKTPAPAPARVPVIAASPTTPAPKQEKETPVRPAAPAPAPKAALAPARPAPAPTPAPAARAETAPAPAAAPRPTPAAKPSTGTVQAAPQRSFLKSPALLAVVAVLVVVLGLGAFYYNKFTKEREAARIHLAKIEQDQAEQAKALREAQEKAAEEAKARKAAEEAIAKKNAEAEALAKKADEIAKQRADDASRILNGRGSLVIATEPPGASVAMSNFAALTSPATVNDLRLGRYTVDISMPGFDSQRLEVEVKDNTVANPGVVKLVRQTGSLEITTDPAGSTFEVRPAGPRVSLGAEVKTGKTPATVQDLPTGDYAVTVRREGWPDHTENVTIEHGRTAHAVSKYVGGGVTITSAPVGARVTRNGEALGVTPLTLTDQQPGDVSYALDLQGFISTTVDGKIEAEKTLTLNANLGAEDRIVPLRELDEKPVQIKTVQPELGYEAKRNPGSATISFIVDRDGTPKEIKVVASTGADFAQACVAAVAQWRFKPGSIKGVPVRTRVEVAIQ
jgi:TonB family protein